MGNWRITIEGTGVHHNGTIAVFKVYSDEEAVAIKEALKANGKASEDISHFSPLDGPGEIIVRGGIPYKPGGPKYPEKTTVEWRPRVPEDSNSQFYAFVKSLKAMGHKINAATFEVLGQTEYVDLSNL